MFTIRYIKRGVRMKPLTLEETRLKEEMKERCLTKGQYIDEKAKAKFDMLCHLEDFEVQYWELQQENKQLKDELKSNPDTQITLQDDKGNKFMVIQTERIDMQVELNKTIEKLFNNWNKLKEYLRDFDIEYLNEIMEHNLANTLENILSKMQELEQGSGINEKNDSI